MNKYSSVLCVPLLGGAAAFLLRLAQNRTGYEAGTGLPVPGNPFALAVPLLLLFLALAAVALACRLPEDGEPADQTFVSAFSTKDAAPAALLVAGSLLWMAAGVSEAALSVPLLEATRGQALISAAGTASPALSVFLGAFTALSGAVLLPVISACRRGAPPERNPKLGNLLLLPTACMVVRVVLTYRADSVNPALSVYYIEILALTFLVLGVYRTASFAFHCGRTRRFAGYNGCGLVLCLATLADGHGLPATLLYLGGAAVSAGLLSARMAVLAPPPGKRIAR